MDEAWVGEALEAWDAIARNAIRRTRRGSRVLDGPGGRRAPLWPVTQVLWAAAEARALGGDPPLAGLVAGLARFARRDGFAAAPRAPRYFDDNAWLGLASLRLAEVTGDDSHRERAASLAAFVRSGEVPDGGVLWSEESRSRNTCSTAAAAWLNLAVDPLDEATRAFAMRAMQWLDRELLGPDALYGDRVSADGERVGARLSYNQGAALAATALLGLDPVPTARAALERFRGERLWKQPPAFVVIMLRALLATPAVAALAAETVDDYATRLIRDARSSTGWFTAGGVGSYDGRPTIDQAAVAQVLSFRARR